MKCLPIILLLLLVSCTTQPLPEERTIIGPNEIRTVNTYTIPKGVAGVIPTHNAEPTDEDWNDFFANLGEYGELWGIYVDIEDSLQDNIPQQVHLAYELKKMRPVTPVIAYGFKDFQKEKGNFYSSIVVTTAQKYHPRYFGLGVEVNLMENFDDYLYWYNTTYKQIKQVSPGTKVFPIIQYETMLNTQDDAWLETVPMDLLGITVYPFMAFDNPGAIPPEYIVEDRPVLITETGWPSENIAGVKGDQSAYVKWTKTLPINVEGVMWSFPHDPMLNDPIWDSVSLKYSNGTKKEAFGYW